MRRFVRNGLVAALALVATTRAGVVKSHGALKIQNHRVVDNQGTPIQLAGMSLYWPEWGGATFYTSQAVQTLVNDWKSTLVRAPFPVYTPNATPPDQYNASYETQVKAVVQAAIDNDIYVIVDWHVEGDNVEEDHAKTFFKDIASAFPNSPNILWEVWNEPISTSWDGIKSYATDIINVIRPYSANIVIVGSPSWSHTPNNAVSAPLTVDPNIAYTTHFYACSDGATVRNTVTSAAGSVPIFFTEWGTTLSSGTGQFCQSESDTWLALAKSLGISWANWSFSNMGGLSGALSSTSLTALSTSGTYVKGKIQEVYAALPAASSVRETGSPSTWGRGLSAHYDGSLLVLDLPAGTRSLSILDPSGRRLFHRRASEGRISVPLEARGVVWIQADGDRGSNSIPLLLAR